MTRSKRQHGAGTIEHRGPGRERARITDASGKRIELGVFPTAAKAEQAIVDAHRRLTSGGMVAVGGLTLAGFTAEYFAIRQKRLRRDLQPDRSRWTVHVAPSSIGQTPMRALDDHAIEEWALGLLDVTSREHAKLILALVRDAFAVAKRARIVDTNPATGVRLPRAAETHEPWTYLEPAEQRALVAAIPEPYRSLVVFALGTGMRKGELWGLRLADLHVGATETNPRVVVRHGTLHGATKGRRIRTLPLAGPWLAAARAWIAALPDFLRYWENKHGLVFPGELGQHRGERPPAQWRKWLAAAGIDRRVRFHDLRHTCGASLISGWWGPPWRLEEVRDWLGHTSTRQTERYAHLAQHVLRDAARGTIGLSLGPQAAPAIEADRDALLVHSRSPALVGDSARNPRPGEIQGRIDAQLTASAAIGVRKVALARAVLGAAGGRRAHRERLRDRLLRVATSPVDDQYAGARRMAGGAP